MDLQDPLLLLKSCSIFILEHDSCTIAVEEPFLQGLLNSSKLFYTLVKPDHQHKVLVCNSDYIPTFQHSKKHFVRYLSWCMGIWIVYHSEICKMVHPMFCRFYWCRFIHQHSVSCELFIVTNRCITDDKEDKRLGVIRMYYSRLFTATDLIQTIRYELVGFFVMFDWCFILLGLYCLSIPKDFSKEVAVLFQFNDFVWQSHSNRLFMFLEWWWWIVFMECLNNRRH